MGFEPGVLQAHAAALQQRCAAIQAEADRVVGEAVNLASPRELSDALYTRLRLQPPPDCFGRPAPKTHLPTDEAALRHLERTTGCALPALVLEHRALQNVLTKYVQPEWVVAAAVAAQRAGSSLARVHCRWQQTSVATGRLSCSDPNLQAVTKYCIGDDGAGDAEEEAAASPMEDVPSLARVNVRDAFVAAPGCVLLTADYSQVELRLLAHLSNDARLQQLLCTAGPAGDVFCTIAAAWLRNNTCGPDQISRQERQRAKGVVYSVVYGQGAAGLAQQLGVPQPDAQRLIKSFLDTFPQVKQFIASAKSAAHAHGEVRMMTGRRRPLQGINSAYRRVVAEDERRAVNSIVQGSAADVIKAAMVAWSHHAAAPGAPAARLLAQIHDELLFEVPEAQVGTTAAVVRHIMEGAAQLAVPLHVSIETGRRWGSMQPLQEV